MLASRLQTLVKTKGTILDRWLADGQECASIALRVPLGVIFFGSWRTKNVRLVRRTMQYFTQSLHIPAPLAAVAILVELLGGLALLAGVFTRWTAILERGILSSGW
jgi:putative oxidoreductase